MRKYLGQNIAIIPIRGGSKSIPHKNIKHIAGKPLFAWTLESATYSGIFDKIIISTDSLVIKEEVIRYINKHMILNKNDITIIMRSKETSSDLASTESVLLEVFKEIQCDNICLIQATSPLTTKEDFISAYKLYSSESYDSLLTGVRQKRFNWEIKNNLASPLNYNYNDRPRRQEFDGYLVENGAFYFMKYEGLLKHKCRLFDNIGFYEMHETTYYEIDEPSDWIILEQLLKRSNPFNSYNKVELFVTDNDGVLTDAGMYYSESGELLKKYNTRDGMGIGLLNQLNIPTIMITGENSKIAESRGKKLGFLEIHLGIKNKLELIEEISDRLSIPLESIAYIGDDINDLEVLSKVGHSFAVADATNSVQAISNIVLTKNGGQGAVREAIDWLISNNYLALTGE